MERLTRTLLAALVLPGALAAGQEADTQAIRLIVRGDETSSMAKENVERTGIEILSNRDLVEQQDVAASEGRPSRR